MSSLCSAHSPNSSPIHLSPAHLPPSELGQETEASLGLGDEIRDLLEEFDLLQMKESTVRGTVLKSTSLQTPAAKSSLDHPQMGEFPRS